MIQISKVVEVIDVTIVCPSIHRSIYLSIYLSIIEAEMAGNFNLQRLLGNIPGTRGQNN